ncbi:hypothetical protein BpHYR1_052427 [Brachionus plicatilis]|uniref:Uncharacterized protein n=1 Tax=Brachionus plicatilis TaxID=10195 RepID=A0A3M7R0R6_BRAPC|nr:hypothetical protein BpHYR1_052427 [Brachionus plicatilis]
MNKLIKRITGSIFKNKFGFSDRGKTRLKEDQLTSNHQNNVANKFFYLKITYNCQSVNQVFGSPIDSYNLKIINSDLNVDCDLHIKKLIKTKIEFMQEIH